MSLIMLLTLSMTGVIIIYPINALMVIKPDINKLSPYDGGFDPLGDARSPISIQFFLVAILFILFDLEIVLLLPIPWSMNTNPPLTSITLTMILLSLLALGLIYEWHQGGLEWTE
uniref:NADH-ubiquinone oxidoreductase chain 3 n=1 Tax=Python molurus molurus TaxID=621282 RepID=F8RBY0_PYTMO|nr:NADH dehydrogenase subunit 3 [Python molurus molurus]ADK72506.1 NADH dehydrogenase subunit 3 [Python molurus molurus]